MRRAECEPDIDLFFANSFRLSEDLDGSLHKQDANAGLPDTLDGKELFLRLPTEKISLFHRTCLYKAEKARALDFYRVNIVSSDWESFFRYILTGKVGFFPDYVAVWRIHGENATRTMSADERIANLQRIVGPYTYASNRKIFPNKIIRDWFDRMLFKQADVDVRDLIRSGDGAGRRRYLSALRTINSTVYFRVNLRPKILWKKIEYFTGKHMRPR
jgi:hypothetical protein